MSQRINASRVVVRVNNNSPAAKDKSKIPQNRRSGRTSTGSVVLPPSSPSPPPSDRSIPLSNRRMSRSQPGNQGIPLEMFRQQASPLPPVQATPGVRRRVPPPAGFAVPPADQLQTSTSKYSAPFPAAPAVADVTLSPEPPEYDEDYTEDLPAYLLSQKYFGTRF